MSVRWTDTPIGTPLRERPLFLFIKDYSRRSGMQGSQQPEQQALLLTAGGAGDIGDDIDIAPPQALTVAIGKVADNHRRGVTQVLVGCNERATAVTYLRVSCTREYRFAALRLRSRASRSSDKSRRHPRRGRGPNI
jgi:hypothetical protein